MNITDYYAELQSEWEEQIDGIIKINCELMDIYDSLRSIIRVKDVKASGKTIPLSAPADASAYQVTMGHRAK